jgi:hypothetical protein
MKYIVVTTDGQTTNSFGGKNFKKIGEVSASGMRDATKRAVAEFGAKAQAMMPSDWDFFCDRTNDARVRAAR